MPGKSERKQGSPPRPATPPRSSPGRLAAVDQQSYPQQGEHSSFQALPRPTNLVSRTGSSPALNLMGHEPGHRDDARRKHHPSAVQVRAPEAPVVVPVCFVTVRLGYWANSRLQLPCLAVVCDHNTFLIEVVSHAAHHSAAYLME